MFKPEILQKLKDLNINTITNTLKEAEHIHPLMNLPLIVRLPYAFATLYNDELLNQYIRSPSTVGYITVNGITTLILYFSDPEQQKNLVTMMNIKSKDGNYMVTDSLELKHTDKISIFHKSFKKKTNVDTSAQVSILDEFAELSKKPNNLFYADYARKHPYFYFYKKPLESKENNFKDYKFFKLYCTLLYIAEKSNIIKQKRTQCHISPKDLMAIIPNCFKYIHKENPSKTTEKKAKKYSKGYITFLKAAFKAGIIEKASIKDGYLLITFSGSFLNDLCEPPFIKIPFGLVNEISTNNYQFIMYFISRQFSNNPKKPYFIKIKIKELLKLGNISLSTSQTMAAKRLNAYLSILDRYHAINLQITYIAEDIRKDRLLKFRLYPFKHISIDIEEEDEEDYED